MDTTINDDESKIEILINRCNENFAKYYEEIMGFPKFALIDMAGRISATVEANQFLNNYDFSDSELDFYLKFQNPLEVITDALVERVDLQGDMKEVMGASFAMNPQLLTQYSLVEEARAPYDPDLRRFMGVDIVDFLGEVANKVMVENKMNWDMDITTLYKLSYSKNPDDMRQIWFVSANGTQLHSERDTFIKDTPAYKHWAENRPDSADTFGYYIEITGRVDSNLIGNIYEIGDYPDHARHVKETALTLNDVYLTYSTDWGVNAGKTITVPRYQYVEESHRLMNESGNVVAIKYNPWEGVRTMSDLMKSEQSMRMSYQLGNLETHIEKIEGILAEERTPPTPAKKSPKKPKTLQEKLQAAEEKVKSQGAGGKTKKSNREERG